ncbi:unknown [Ruminococcus sp. CAG:563]|nr:unknown [Ruminococcus sp. CAG:563]
MVDVGNTFSLSLYRGKVFIPLTTINAVLGSDAKAGISEQNTTARQRMALIRIFAVFFMIFILSKEQGDVAFGHKI